MENLSSVLARRLKTLRESRGLTLAALSKEITEQYGVHISKESLTNYEVVDSFHSKAKKNEGMSVKYLRCLADFYNVSTDYLLGITQTPNREPDIKKLCDTGLSSDAVASLQRLGETTISISVLNLILSHPDFKSYLDTLFMCAIQTAAYKHLRSQIDFTSLLGSVEEQALKTTLSDSLDITELRKNRACKSVEEFVLNVLMNNNISWKGNDFPETIPKLQDIVSKNAIVVAERAVHDIIDKFPNSKAEQQDDMKLST